MTIVHFSSTHTHAFLFSRRNSSFSSSSTSSSSSLESDSNSINRANAKSMSLVRVCNTQKKQPIDKVKIQRAVADIKRVLQLCPFRVDVHFCSETRMKEINDTWRGTRHSTDVLSFPELDFPSGGRREGRLDPAAIMVAQAQALAVAGKGQDSTEAVVPLLGTIVVAPSYVLRQCLADRDDKNSDEQLEEWEKRGVAHAMSRAYSLERRLALLLVHSMLHLLGYDHDSVDDWRVMAQKEEEVLRKLGERWPNKNIHSEQ
jgi:probable rRNA maturation factor